MKICKFCGKKVEKLVDAHIYPKSFFEYTRTMAGLKKNQNMLLVTNKKGLFPKKKLWIGSYDPNLVCSTCEAIFGPYDDYATNLLVQNQNKQRPILIDGELKGWEIAEFDFDKLESFVLSVLWRAGASELPEFNRVNLGRGINNIKDTILDRNITNRPSFIMSRFPDRIGQSIIPDPFLEYGKSIFANLDIYRFYLGAGYVVYIKVGPKPFPPISSLFIVVKNQPLRIRNQGDYLLSKEVSVLRKVMADVGKSMTKIRNKN